MPFPRPALAALAAIAGCSDGPACGPGTEDVDGTCTPTTTCGPGTRDDGAGQCVPDGSVVCTGGLVFDPATGSCAIGPNGCADPFVVVDGVCQDPTAGLAIDVEEGTEPNGLGLLGEVSAHAAGAIALKPVGASTVIHGTISPATDRDGDGSPDPDIDTYVVTVAAPTLLAITADGTHGLAAGFAVFPYGVDARDPIARWRRLGINLAGDLSSRQVFLPRAGSYVIGVADTRSLFVTAGAAGIGDYYMTIAVEAIPTPTPLALGAGDHGQIGGDVKFYTPGELGPGLAEVVVDSPSNAAELAIEIVRDGAFRNEAHETFDEMFGVTVKLPGDLVFGGITQGDSTLVVVDAVYNYALAPVDCDVSKLVQQPAIALPTTGGTITDTVRNNFYEVLKDANLYYFDVAAADEIDGLIWHSSIHLDAKLVDDTGREIADFSTNGGAFDGFAFTDYRGLLRFPHAGRYYFVAVADFTDDFGAPVDAVGEPFQITTTAASVAPTTLAMGTPLTEQPISTFGAAAFACDPGATSWYGFAVRQSDGSASTGTMRVSLYDPQITYGRLDPLTVRRSSNPTAPPLALNGDAHPHLMYAVPQTGASFGQLAVGTDTPYLIEVVPTTTTGARSIDIAMTARSYTDLATMGVGAEQTRLGDQLTPAAPARLYFVQANPGTKLTITVTPDPALDAQIETLFADESMNLLADGDGPGGVEVLTFTQPDTGSAPSYTAFAVTSASPLASPASYDIAIQVAAATHYTASAGATVYADACTGGTVVPFVYGARGGPPNYDEGLTDVVNLPSPAFDNFHYFGDRAIDSDGDGSPDLTISSNGWLTMDAYSAFDPLFANVQLPDESAAAIVAPYWDDLDKVVVCTQAVGTDFIVQWTGALFDPLDQNPPRVAMQAIFHAADNTIELVYAPDHAATGASATIGIADELGLNASEVSFDSQRDLAGSAILLTPQ